MINEARFVALRRRLLLPLWALLTLATLGWLLWSDIQVARERLEHQADQVLQHVSDRALISEAAVEGFAAFVASSPRLDHRAARGYAQRLLDRYPFLYVLEVAERRTAGMPGELPLRHFDYAHSRSWQPLSAGAVNYPITFIEPVLPGTGKLLGMDLLSSDFLRQTLAEAARRRGLVTTPPFDLAEGGRGYVLMRPVSDAGVDAAPHRFVLLALQADKLFAVPAHLPADVDLRITHAAAETGDPAGELLHRWGGVASPLANAVLPAFHIDRILPLASQPFVLHLEKQLRLADINLLAIAVALLLALLLLLGMRLYARLYLGDRLRQMDAQGELYELANFDPLTGLANRYRLMDHLETELMRARRHHRQLSLLFMDLDGFKPVNDEHGHAAGDAVLVEVAHRLSGQLREDDLLARYGGDEFVWVSSEPLDEAAVRRLMRRVRGEFERPFSVGKVQVELGVSIGCARYPQDGRNIAALIEVADRQMYRDKARCRGGDTTTVLSHCPVAEAEAE